MVESLLVAVLVLLAVVAVLVATLLYRQRGGGVGAMVAPHVKAVADGQRRLEELLREDAVRRREGEAREAARLRHDTAESVRGMGDSVVNVMARLGEQQQAQISAIDARLASLTRVNDARLEALRGVVDTRLRELQEENGMRLDEMRRTVDERLESSLERRLGDSFQQVSERLEAVHKGLGEMQALAQGVGDLKRVLTNVKTRGTWGEVQLGGLLEQVLAPEQYVANACCVPHSSERVEYAVRLPGRGNGQAECVLLPIDAKFPLEDYERLVEARSADDRSTAEQAARQLESRVRKAAKDIRSKYVNPPHTTDFAIMFLPTEGLFAEVLGRPGLSDALQHDHRVVVAGPTTLAALLNSLHVGFRSVAIERRSSEVWELLGAVKTEFARFGEMLAKVQQRLHQATESVDRATKATRSIERRLRDVEESPVRVDGVHVLDDDGAQ